MEQTQPQEQETANKKQRSGRPTKEKTERKEFTLLIRLTAHDKQYLDNLFKTSEYGNRSQMYYDMLFRRQLYQKDAQTVIIHDQMQEMIQEMRAIGVNFNQLVKKVNSFTNNQMIVYELEKAVVMMAAMRKTEAKIYGEVLKLSDKWSQELQAEKILPD